MEQVSLFTSEEDTRPLADRMRPETLEEYVGQTHLVSPGKILWRMIEQDKVSSMIFWGPPGVGKTTLARIIAAQTKSHFVNFSAVTSGIKEIKAVMKDAQMRKSMGQETILFVDEIIVLIKPNKMRFYPMSKRAALF